MSQPRILELAQQGDAQVIAYLINQQLQPKGITSILFACLIVLGLIIRIVLQ